MIDGATLNPGEARFFVMPFNRKVLGLNIPFAQSPENTVIDFSHQGVNMTYPESYGSCTVATTGLRLGEFPDTDLKGSHLSGDAWVAVRPSSIRISYSLDSQSSSSWELLIHLHTKVT